MSECVFCDVVAGTETAHRVYEDDRTLAFLDAEPAASGHTLIVPRVHRETLARMEADLAADVFRTVRRVATALEDAFDPDGTTVVQSNGAAAGQEIFHAHVHVVPRFEDDDVTIRWTGEPRSEDPESIAATLREAL